MIEDFYDTTYWKTVKSIIFKWRLFNYLIKFNYLCKRKLKFHWMGWVFRSSFPQLPDHKHHSLVSRCSHECSNILFLFTGVADLLAVCCACVSRRHQHLLNVWRLGQLPGQRMFPSTASDHQHLYHHCALRKWEMRRLWQWPSLGS